MSLQHKEEFKQQVHHVDGQELQQSLIIATEEAIESTTNTSTSNIITQDTNDRDQTISTTTNTNSNDQINVNHETNVDQDCESKELIIPIDETAQYNVDEYFIDFINWDYEKISEILLQSILNLNTIIAQCRKYIGNFVEEEFFRAHILNGALHTDNIPIIDFIIKELNINFNGTTLENPYVLSIVNAIERGNLIAFEHLVEHYNVKPIELQAYYHIHSSWQHVFFTACLKDRPKLVSYLAPTCLLSLSEDTLHKSIVELVKFGQLELLQKLIHQYNIIIKDIKATDGNNLLQFLIDQSQSTNCLDFIDYLITDIGIDVNGRNNRQTPLQIAFNSFRWDIVQHLVSKHNVDIRSVFDANGLLMVTASKDKQATPDLIDWIVKTFGLNEIPFKKYNSTTNSLCYAIMNDNLPLVKHLITKYNARITDPNGESNFNILTRVIYNGQYINLSNELIQYLVNDLGININAPYANENIISLVITRRSASRFWLNESDFIEPEVLEENQLQVIQTLIANNVSVNYLENMTRAYKCHKYRIFKWLFEHNREVTKDLLRHMYGKIFKSCIEHSPSIELVSFFISLHKEKPFDDFNGFVNDACRRTASCQVDIIKLLIQNGCDYSQWHSMLPNSGQRPYQQFKCLNYLIQEKYCNMNDELGTDAGLTPISSLCHHRSLTFNYDLLSSQLTDFNWVIRFCTFINFYKTNANHNYSHIGSSIYHVLASTDNTSLIRFVLQHNCEKPNLYIKNNKQRTFLHTLAENHATPNYHSVRYTEYFEQLMDCIIDYV